MKMIIHPSSLNGTITAPASKSAMQRACAAALLRKGRTILSNPGISDDDKAALDIISRLGASVSKEGEQVVIVSRGVHPGADSIDCGESGLSVRMFTPIAACSERKISINGHGSLVKRPLRFFDEVLPQLDVKIDSANGYLPLSVQGPLLPRHIEVDGSLSSQFLTGLLMAFSAQGASDVRIDVRDLASKPYIDLTLEVMKSAGLKLPKNEDYRSFYFDHSQGVQHDATWNYEVEGDWSGAAFLLVAGAIGGDMVVKGLDVFSAQADKAVLQPMMQAGVSMSIEPGRIEVRKSVIRAFHFDATHCPDLFPPLVALAACAEEKSVIEGVHRLEHKESNRAESLQEEFKKLGVNITLQDDLMIIEGTRELKAAKTFSHGDHRIAMACAVAASRAGGIIEVEGAEAVSKSYPGFWNDMRSLGMQAEGV